MQGEARPDRDIACEGIVSTSEDAIPVPQGLHWLTATPRGSAWLSELPRLVAGCARDWQLTVRAPLEPGSVSWVAHAERPDGSRAVLKVSFPDAETEHEAEALELWAGRGAVRLYAYDRARHSLLLEPCEPGAPLWDVAHEDAANRIAAGVLARLWRPVPDGTPFRSLATDARRWARELPARYTRHGRPFARRLLEEAVSLCADLVDTQPEFVLCHQDFHGGNVLSAGEDRWLAIDPKPLVGERAFDLASLLRDRRDKLLSLPSPDRTIRRRLDLLTSSLSLERERVRGWGIVHALAWGLTEDDVNLPNIACAELLAAC